LMHGSGSSFQETAAVRLYLDDSGGDDPGTPDAVIGGMLINYSEFHVFEDSWEARLDRHCIIPPLHMREFGKDGRFAHITPACRFELFSEVSELINRHKIYSLAAITNNPIHRENVAPEMRENFGVYGMCFLLMVAMSHKLADMHRHNGKIPFILDTGNPYKGRVADAHAEAIRMQREIPLHLGGLHFEDDRDFGILQAADVIAWGSRRKATNISIPKPFSPIQRILEMENGHVQKDWDGDWMKTISGNVMKRYEQAKAEANEKSH